MGHGVEEKKNSKDFDTQSTAQVGKFGERVQTQKLRHWEQDRGAEKRYCSVVLKVGESE